MNFEIKISDEFEVAAKQLSKRYRSFVDDYSDFLDDIRKNPYQGVEFMPGIRKVRLAIASKGKGKSGGARIITFTYTISEKDGVVYLLLVYDKSDASTVKKKAVMKMLKELGFDIPKMQTEGVLKPIEIEETDKL